MKNAGMPARDRQRLHRRPFRAAVGDQSEGRDPAAVRLRKRGSACAGEMLVSTTISMSCESLCRTSCASSTASSESRSARKIFQQPRHLDSAPANRQSAPSRFRAAGNSSDREKARVDSRKFMNPSTNMNRTSSASRIKSGRPERDSGIGFSDARGCAHRFDSTWEPYECPAP